MMLWKSPPSENIQYLYRELAATPRRRVETCLPPQERSWQIPTVATTTVHIFFFNCLSTNPLSLESGGLFGAPKHSGTLAQPLGRNDLLTPPLITFIIQLSTKILFVTVSVQQVHLCPKMSGCQDETIWTPKETNLGHPVISFLQILKQNRCMLLSK